MTTHLQNHLAADTVSSMCLNFGVKNFSLISSAFDQLMNECSQREALVSIVKIFYAFHLIPKPLDEVLNVQQVFSSLFKQNFLF